MEYRQVFRRAVTTLYIGSGCPLYMEDTSTVLQFTLTIYNSRIHRQLLN